jgi:glycine cleavage system H protein
LSNEYQVPNHLLYTKEHEWVKGNEKKSGIIGITDYAVKMLHEVVYVSLPDIGSTVKQGQTLGAVESIKAVSDVYSPFSGKVTKTNERLRTSPELVTQQPYLEGWLIEIEISNYEKEVGNLFSPNQYIVYINNLRDKKL